MMQDSEAAKHIKPDELGHRTRYSDSSLYDEKCVLCGATDATYQQGQPLREPCPKAVEEPSQ